MPAPRVILIRGAIFFEGTSGNPEFGQQYRAFGL
jgi:hypothetical protein